MEELTDKFLIILHRMVPRLYGHIAQGQSTFFAFLGPGILTKSDQYYNSCELQSLDEVMIW